MDMEGADVLSNFDIISAGMRAVEKERELTARKLSSLDGQMNRLSGELTSARVENERLSNIVKDQSATIASLRDEGTLFASAVSAKAQMMVELVGIQRDQIAMQISCKISEQRAEYLEQELKDAHDRLKALSKENEDLKKLRPAHFRS